MAGETLKQRVENYFAVVVLGIIVLSGGAGRGVAAWVSLVQRQAASNRFDAAQQQCTAQIRDLEKKLASIDRNPAGGEYIDIRKFAVTRVTVNFTVDVNDNNPDTFQIQWPRYMATGAVKEEGVAIDHDHCKCDG